MASSSCRYGAGSHKTGTCLLGTGFSLFKLLQESKKLKEKLQARAVAQNFLPFKWSCHGIKPRGGRNCVLNPGTHLSSRLKSRGSTQLKFPKFHYIPITPLKKQTVPWTLYDSSSNNTKSSPSCITPQKPQSWANHQLWRKAVPRTADVIKPAETII